MNYAERLPHILAIPDQIKQVFFNLLNNTTDACPEKAGTITIGTRLEGERIAVTFRDNGIGIEPEKLELIFQPFYTSKHETQGTGLGLSVCRGIVEAIREKFGLRAGQERAQPSLSCCLSMARAISHRGAIVNLHRNFCFFPIVQNR